MNSITVCGREIGSGHRPWIIAELGINHDGNPDTAVALVNAAAEAGADAVKLQVFEPSQFISRQSPYIDIFNNATIDKPTIEQLIAAAAEANICLFPTVFDEGSADLCASLSVPAMKIASGDLTHIPLIRHVANIGLPMLLSTGGGKMGEIATALDAIYDVSPQAEVGLFHCVSNYPTNPEDANLACIRTMRDAFNVPVGFSDHSTGSDLPITAVALGADMIEKHFTLDRSTDGPDHALSADPAIMRTVVDGTANAHLAIGSSRKAPVEPDDFIPVMRRSVTADVDIAAGTKITAGMLAIKRPGSGIPPVQFSQVVGMIASEDISAETTLDWHMLKN
jgi:sialic acid synthase SpsE